MKKLILLLLIVTATLSIGQAQVRIKMKNENGVYTTPCTVNGLRLRFIFDTGASNVSISLSEAIFMLKNGYLNEEDLKGASYSQLANGEVISNTSVIIKELEIAGIVLNNVEAIIIHDLSAPLLLGQSAIQRLGKFQIDGDELLIITKNSVPSEDAYNVTKEMLIKAKDYYFNELDNLSYSTYKEAYNICPTAFECKDFDIWGTVCSNTDKYEEAIKYLNIASRCTEKNKSLHFIYSNLGYSYGKIRDYDNALISLEKALSLTDEDDRLASIFFSIGLVKANQQKYSEAVKNYEICVKYRLNYLSVTMEDVFRGKVKDGILGEAFYNTYFGYIKDHLTPPDTFIALAAICGSREAMMVCNELGINYERYIKK